MYSLNPTMTEMLTQQRVSELSSQIALSRRSGRAERELAKKERLYRLHSLQKATGWALVELGLRLALPRRSAVPRRPRCLWCQCCPWSEYGPGPGYCTKRGRCRRRQSNPGQTTFRVVM